MKLRWFELAVTVAIVALGLVNVPGCKKAETPSPQAAKPKDAAASKEPARVPRPIEELQKPPAFTLPASQLAQDFAADEKAATEKYKGKLIQVEGVVEDVKLVEGVMPTVSVSLAPANPDEKAPPKQPQVVCDLYNYQDMLTIKKGQKASLKGIVASKTDNTIRIEDCIRAGGGGGMGKGGPKGGAKKE